MVAHAQERGIAGIVINGAIRDRDTLREWTMPVFARGVSHRGPYKNGPGEIGGAEAEAGPESTEAPLLCVMPPVLTGIGCVVLFFYAEDIYRLLMGIVTP